MLAYMILVIVTNFWIFPLAELEVLEMSANKTQETERDFESLRIKKIANRKETSY